jgi:hypothetical protein
VIWARRFSVARQDGESNFNRYLAPLTTTRGSKKIALSFGDDFLL